MNMRAGRKEGAQQEEKDEKNERGRRCYYNTMSQREVEVEVEIEIVRSR